APASRHASTANATIVPARMIALPRFLSAPAVRLRLADPLRLFLVGRLFLTALVAHDALAFFVRRLRRLVATAPSRPLVATAFPRSWPCFPLDGDDIAATGTFLRSAEKSVPGNQERRRGSLVDERQTRTKANDGLAISKRSRGTSHSGNPASPTPGVRRPRR